MPKPKTDPNRPTREQVKKLRAAGLTVIQIAGALGISRARVYQHLEKLNGKEPR